MPTPPNRRIVQGLLGAKGGDLPMGLLGRQGAMSSYTPTVREKMAGLLAKGWFGDTREGYRKAGKVMDVADMTPVGLLTGMYDAGRAGGRGDYAQAGLLAGLAALPLPGNIKKATRDGKWSGAFMRDVAPASESATRGKSIRAYHGSPHDFDKFSMDKIGTGEGAQAYGHGLYFAEGEGVAKSYRDNLTKGATALVDGVPISQLDLSESAKSIALMQAERQAGGYKYDDLTEMWERNTKSLKTANETLAKYPNSQVALLNKASAERSLQGILELQGKKIEFHKPKGHMYEVNIDADPDQFLDWDKPLSEQPHIQEALQSIPEYQQHIDQRLAAEAAARQASIQKYGYDPLGNKAEEAYKNPTGSGAFKTLSHVLGGDEVAAKALLGRKADLPDDVLRAAKATAGKPSSRQTIPGIKYLDAGSRAKGDGSRNYVVFDENLISIVRKYGIAGASALLGYDVLSNVTDEQAKTLQQAERVY